MDFHQHQEQARRRSRHLLMMFCLAVALVMLGINLLGAFLWGLFAPGLDLPQYFVATNCLIVALYVLGGGWLEWQRLQEGGASVAHRLGAQSPNPYQPRHQRLLNVAEELAIAAGIPVPEVFILDHDAINALTAGHDSAHCALVVTRGSLEQLSRSELQAVVAHEYAHIVNGDVALNTRLTGALYGLCSLSMLGRAMLSGVFKRDRAQTVMAPAPLLLFGGVMFGLIGWLGALSARLVQSGVSRQREFLADAQAVQFTRDRDSLGRALRKIAGQSSAAMDSEYCDVVAHLWLSSESGRSKWFDTHPPLVTRIRRLHGRPLPPIKPSTTALDEHERGSENSTPVIETLDWPGQELPAGSAAFAQSSSVSDKPLPRQDAAVQEQTNQVVEQVSRHAGEADVLIQAVRSLGSNLSQAALLLNAIVAGPVAESAGSNGVAPDRSGSDPADHLNALSESGQSALSVDLDRVHQALLWLEDPHAQWLRVPLLELLASRVRHWPEESRRTLVRYCHDAVHADGRIEKTEWIYFTLIRHRLLPHERVPREWASATQKRRALAEVFSMAGHLSDQSARKVRDAVVMAAAHLDVEQPTATPDEFEFRSLSTALDVLRALSPLRKPLLLKSLQSLSRQENSATYQAFLAAVASAIDCPPLTPFTPLSARLPGLPDDLDPVEIGTAES